MKIKALLKFELYWSTVKPNILKVIKGHSWKMFHDFFHKVCLVNYLVLSVLCCTRVKKVKRIEKENERIISLGYI